MKQNHIGRRDFLVKSSLATAGLMAARLTGWAKHLNVDTVGGRVFSDSELVKNLDPQWVASLYKRGSVTTYLKSKNELQYIGMPVGGIATGMVYAGGDGRLWLWDIFNRNQVGVIYKEIPWHENVNGMSTPMLRSWDGANYVVPVKDVRPLEQGFALKFEFGGKTVVKRLQADDWDEIGFEATYPMATVHYKDKNLPLFISAKIYSPFIPLDQENSGLPATIYTFEFKNNSPRDVKISVTGWLENKAAIYYARDDQFFRTNEAVKTGDNWMVKGTVHDKNWGDQNLETAPDFGELGISSLNKGTIVNTHADLSDNSLFNTENKNKTVGKVEHKLVGSVSNSILIKSNQSEKLDYFFCWYFPNLTISQVKTENKHYYANNFKSVTDVANYIGLNFEKLSKQSQLWQDTWYNESTLPYWFLERAFANVSTLATTTTHWFSSGRFYGWEGIGSCPGTCNHVYQYAQANARIFPYLERDIRERIDLGIAFYDDGHIGFRGEYDHQASIDGQSGRVLGIYREHQMSENDAFLKRVWPKTKKAVQYIIAQDKNGDGMLDTPIENTLDAKWPGEIAWLVGLCIAAVKAGELMAVEMNDTEFVATCKDYVIKGRANMAKELFNGEYFIHRPDVKLGKTVIGSFNTCHIDQVYGQSWAFQVGIKDRVIDKEKTISALNALWKYNFTTDVGPYLETHHGGRAYALPGEGGVIMNTNPKKDPRPFGVEDAWQLGYFHECMSGFEHQLSSHFMAEGMPEQSLIISRTIHDRYHAAKRNPFNEVECSDHYARAMASYNTFITACGFTYHGPKGYLGFSPKIQKDNFKAPFTSAKGWGSYSQNKANGKQIHRLDMKYGTLELQSFSVDKLTAKSIKHITVKLGDQSVAASHQLDGETVTLNFNKRIKIGTDQTLLVEIA